MVTPSGRSTSMVMAAITVPDDQESSDPVPTVDQHLSRTVAHRGHSGKPQKPWCSHLTPEEPIPHCPPNQDLLERGSPTSAAPKQSSSEFDFDGVGARPATNANSTVQ